MEGAGTYEGKVPKEGGVHGVKGEMPMGGGVQGGR